MTFIVFMLAMLYLYNSSIDDDIARIQRKQDRNDAERRHRELLEATERGHGRRAVRRTRAVKSPDGRVAFEELVYDEDEDDGDMEGE